MLALISAGGTGSPNSNVGAGHRLAITNTNNVKTLFGNTGTGINLDSSANANGITFNNDTTVLSTKANAQRLYDILNSSKGSGTVTSFSAGDLSPLFTTSEATATTTPALSFSLTNAGANTYFGNATGSTGAPSYTSAGALTKTDDTNVTLTLGGNPSTSLLRNTSLTLGWTGQLGTTRGGTNISSYTTGDMLYASATNVLSKLAAGTEGYVLSMVSGVPTWVENTGGGGGDPFNIYITNQPDYTPLAYAPDASTFIVAGLQIRKDGTLIVPTVTDDSLISFNVVETDPTVRETLSAGATSYSVAAGTLIEKIEITEATDITLDVGTTLAWEDLVTNAPVVDGNAVITLNKYFASSGTLYFTGVTGSTVIKIYKR